MDISNPDIVTGQSADLDTDHVTGESADLAAETGSNWFLSLMHDFEQEWILKDLLVCITELKINKKLIWFGLVQHIHIF